MIRIALRNEADYREGRITADVWHKTDDEIRARYAPSYAEYRERDYAGLTGLLDRPDVDIQTLEEEAIEEVMKFEQENDVTDLWGSHEQGYRRTAVKAVRRRAYEQRDAGARTQHVRVLHPSARLR